MNLKFWSWELKFWTLLVLQRSVSHRWFPSPKQISGFHNQNLCENLNRTSFAQTSWFLVKVHIKANSCKIIVFEQFWIPKWRNRPQKLECTRKTEWDRPFFEIFDFLVKVKGQTWSKHFFSQAVRTGSPIRVESKEPSQVESGKWHHYDVIELEGRVWAHEASWRHVGGPNRHVWAREMMLVINRPSGSTWLIVWGRIFWVL